MEYITATTDMADTIQNILHTTIKTVYSLYYPQGTYIMDHPEKEISKKFDTVSLDASLAEVFLAGHAVKNVVEGDQ